MTLLPFSPDEKEKRDCEGETCKWLTESTLHVCSEITIWWNSLGVVSNNPFIALP